MTRAKRQMKVKHPHNLIPSQYHSTTISLHHNITGTESCFCHEYIPIYTKKSGWTATPQSTRFSSNI